MQTGVDAGATLGAGEGLGHWGRTMKARTKWSKTAVGPALKAIEDFTKQAKRLAAHVDDGTVRLSDEEARKLARALESFETHADRLRLQLPGRARE